MPAKSVTCDCPLTAVVQCYDRKHTLWQGLANNCEIRLHANVTEKSITVALNADGRRLATETVKFRTWKARNAAMRRAAQLGSLAI